MFVPKEVLSSETVKKYWVRYTDREKEEYNQCNAALGSESVNKY